MRGASQNLRVGRIAFGWCFWVASCRRLLFCCHRFCCRLLVCGPCRRHWLWMSSCRCRRFLLQLVLIPFCRYRVACSWSLVQCCLCFHCWLWLLFCCFCCLCWLRLMLCCNCRCIFWLQWLLEGTCRRSLVGPRGRISVGSLEHRDFW